MSDNEDFPAHLEQPNEDLDNPLRVIIVVNSPSHPEGEMEERLLDTIQSINDVNTFFDTFDEKVAIPNEGHIKYEVGSDGLVVIVVDTMELRDEALGFIDEHVAKVSSSTNKKQEAEEGEEEVEESKSNKRTKVAN
ncbi:uncharacterized protein RJT20DRAFT_44481 [Scheffersomyces xylosifermentans]|uniref:uncharacterized protein n=1 Tax=Scheffersomyces xylosifermentans TaxID=1304137 RepID=UPI00315D026E